VIHDVAIVGGGPAGSAAAALCAEAGLRTLLLERAVFPREKVCGDCLNPACWPILDRLGVADRVLAQPHTRLAEVEFVSARGRAIRFPLARSARGGIAISRSVFDQVLLGRARELGADVREDGAVTALEPGWKIATTAGAFAARMLIAADGRHSTVARLLGLLPPLEKERVSAQAHVPLPAGFGEKIAMRFRAHGYAGMSGIGGGQFNVCVVSRPEYLPELKAWASAEFGIAHDHPWRTITPIARAAIAPAHENVLFAGDAARVVEPFTGEGIYYALASGALAARHVITNDLPSYALAHARIYRGRLWINEFAKAAVLHPHLAAAIFEGARFFPHALRHLTERVMRPAAPDCAPRTG
jgi:geranylgeranyl reductase family protein